MKLQLSQEEISNAIHSALCNGGLTDLASSSIYLEVDDTKYKAHKQAGDCFEDVLLRMLIAGEEIPLSDAEDDNEIVGTLKLDKITEFINSTEDEQAIEVIQQLVNEEDDSETGYCFIQFVVFGEIIYG